MFLDDIVSPLTVKEAATDYQKRRQRERDVDAGKPVSRQAKNPQTDYAKKRARDKKELELGEEQVNELSKGTLANYVKANANDQVQHASSQSYVSGKNGDKYNTADAWDQRTTKREKGMDRALNKLSQVEEDSWHAGDNAWSSDKNQWSESMDASEPSPVTGAITRRILSQRLDLLKQYGPELVGAAVDNVADYVGDVEEIGSSDVSAWVAQVERMLKENPPEAFDQDMEEGVWDNIKKSFTPDPNWQKRAGQQAGHMAQGAVAGGVHGHAVGHSMADAGVAEGRPEDLPGIDYDRPGDRPRKQSNGEHNPYPYSPEEDDDYFREIFRKKREAAAKAQGGALKEFAPGQGGGAGDYFQALASAWYNGTFNTGSLGKGIKSQQDVERLLQRGVLCPDGVTRKFGIDYNSDFDGVVISSDDYYEHADYNDQGQEVDSRTGQKWGPYDYMEFGDSELDEGVVDALKSSWEKVKNFDSPARSASNTQRYQDLRKQQELKRKQIKNQVPVNELSTEKLAQYKKAAGADATAADKAGDFERGNKRFKGIVKATIKQGDNDAKKHVKESYWTKLENERNTKIAKLVNELKESIK
jgi:hypothetical protein